MDRLEEIRQRTEAGGPIRRIDMKYLLSEVDRITAALTESQRRERAAVEDLKISAYCRTCAKKCGLREALSKKGREGGCKDYEWRGPQEAGKGDSNG